MATGRRLQIRSLLKVNEEFANSQTTQMRPLSQQITQSPNRIRPYDP